MSTCLEKFEVSKSIVVMIYAPKISNSKNTFRVGWPCKWPKDSIYVGYIDIS